MSSKSGESNTSNSSDASKIDLISEDLREKAKSLSSRAFSQLETTICNTQNKGSSNLFGHIKLIMGFGARKIEKLNKQKNELETMNTELNSSNSIDLEKIIKLSKILLENFKDNAEFKKEINDLNNQITKQMTLIFKNKEVTLRIHQEKLYDNLYRSFHTSSQAPTGEGRNEIKQLRYRMNFAVIGKIAELSKQIKPINNSTPENVNEPIGNLQAYEKLSTLEEVYALMKVTMTSFNQSCEAFENSTRIFSDSNTNNIEKLVTGLENQIDGSIDSPNFEEAKKIDNKVKALQQLVTQETNYSVAARDCKTLLGKSSKVLNPKQKNDLSELNKKICSERKQIINLIKKAKTHADFNYLADLNVKLSKNINAAKALLPTKTS
ncbi:MAG: hypothetical protein H0X29_06820 [Parachlamydiaceae bacterium]|nr:hypothetical protein [Parachlamydiaceae bacterium]